MLPSACRSPTSTVPQRGSLRPLCRERRAKRCPPGNRVGRGSYRAPVAGDAPRHQPRVNPRRTRSARTSIPLRGMVAKAVELSAVPSAIRPRSAAFNRMVRSGFCYTDFCWRDGGILTPVRPLHTVFHTTYLLTEFLPCQRTPPVAVRPGALGLRQLLIILL